MQTDFPLTQLLLNHGADTLAIGCWEDQASDDLKRGSVLAYILHLKITCSQFWIGPLSAIYNFLIDWVRKIVHFQFLNQNDLFRKILIIFSLRALSKHVGLVLGSAFSDSCYKAHSTVLLCEANIITLLVLKQDSRHMVNKECY